MSEPLYERYKDALRRGHLAALHGRPDVALDAYGEASRLAPDRALPFVAIAGVLARLGRRDDALAAYDAALDRATGDEAALRGRAELLSAAGDRAGAAETLDRLAVALDGAGRLADATDAAIRALDLAESRGRRDAVRQLADRLERSSPDAAGSEIVAAALSLLDGPTVVPAAEPVPATELPPVPEFVPGVATALVEAAADAGDGPATLALALEAAAGHRRAGLDAAAIDVCYLALGGSPADADLHLALTDLYLDRGWWTMATDKLVLLARLADLTGDAGTRERVCDVAATRLPDEARLAAVCP